ILGQGSHLPRNDYPGLLLLLGLNCFPDDFFGRSFGRRFLRGFLCGFSGRRFLRGSLLGGLLGSGLLRWGLLRWSLFRWSLYRGRRLLHWFLSRRRFGFRSLARGSGWCRTRGWRRRGWSQFVFFFLVHSIIAHVVVHVDVCPLFKIVEFILFDGKPILSH